MERRKFLINRIETDFVDELEVMPADGGLHLCVTFKNKRDDVALASLLADHGLTVRPLSRFYRIAEGKCGMVMGFAGYNPQQLIKALEKLKKLMDE